MRTAGYRAIALTVSSALFMQFLDATALNTALPTMGRDLHVLPTRLNVAILAYQLSMAALIPAGSAFADRIGARRAFVVAVLIFLTGSLLCALSQTVNQLTAARALQGIGGAIMLPVARLLVVRSAERSELISAMNWYIIPGIVGPLLGPVFGGLIVTYSTWHWIFLINIPVGLLGIVLTLLIVPNVPGDGGRRFDVPGLLLIVPIVYALVFGLESLSRPDGLARAALLLTVALLLGFAYLRHARRAAMPAVDLSLFRISSFRRSIEAGTMLRTLLGSAGFILPLWFQLALKMPPVKAGAVMVMMPLGSVLSRAASTPLLKRVHPRTMTVYGIIPAVGMALSFVVVGPRMPLALLAALVGLQGLFLAIPITLLNAVAYVEIPPERMGPATGLFTLVQQLTLSIGVTIGVWAIAAARRIGETSLTDNRTYVLAVLMSCILPSLAILAARKLDRESTGTLRPAPDEDLASPTSGMGTPDSA